MLENSFAEKDLSETASVSGYVQALRFKGLHLTYASEHLDRDASQRTRHRAGTQRATRDGSISRKP